MEDTDEIRLPSDTLLILQEFLKEKQEKEDKEAEQGDDIEKFEENWVGTRDFKNCLVKSLNSDDPPCSNSASSGTMTRPSRPWPHCANASLTRRSGT